MQSRLTQEQIDAMFARACRQCGFDSDRKVNVARWMPWARVTDGKSEMRVSGLPNVSPAKLQELGRTVLEQGVVRCDSCTGARYSDRQLEAAG